MDRKTKKKIETLNKKLSALRQQLAGARRQRDEPEEVEMLARQVADIEAEVKRLKDSSSGSASAS